jgi:hypothetical protein
MFFSHIDNRVITDRADDTSARSHGLIESLNDNRIEYRSNRSNCKIVMIVELEYLKL